MNTNIIKTLLRFILGWESGMLYINICIKLGFTPITSFICTILLVVSVHIKLFNYMKET